MFHSKLYWKNLIKTSNKSYFKTVIVMAFGIVLMDNFLFFLSGNQDRAQGWIENRVHNSFSQWYILSISASNIAEGGLKWETCTRLCAHLKTIQFSSEWRERTLLNLKKNDNIMWRQCAEKIDFYQEVLLLEDCSVRWLGCNLVCLPLLSS